MLAEGCPAGIARTFEGDDDAHTVSRLRHRRSRSRVCVGARPGAHDHQKRREGMSVSAKSARGRLRAFHLVASAVLGTYVYWPWGSEPWFRLLTQVVVL